MLSSTDCKHKHISSAARTPSSPPPPRNAPARPPAQRRVLVRVHRPGAQPDVEGEEREDDELVAVKEAAVREVEDLGA
jgi:hypothetical protein